MEVPKGDRSPLQHQQLLHIVYLFHGGSKESVFSQQLALQDLPRLEIGHLHPVSFSKVVQGLPDGFLLVRGQGDLRHQQPVLLLSEDFNVKPPQRRKGREQLGSVLHAHFRVAGEGAAEVNHITIG